MWFSSLAWSVKVDLLISANILAKRLNFAINPDILPKEEFVVAIEKACCTMEEGFQNEVLGTLRQAKCPQSNLTVEEPTPSYKKASIDSFQLERLRKVE